MVRSVCGREHCAELIQMTVRADQLVRRNAALLSGPSWAAPHVILALGAQRAKTKPPAAGPRRAARRRVSTWYRSNGT